MLIESVDTTTSEVNETLQERSGANRTNRMWLCRVDAKRAQKKPASFGAPKVSSVVLIVAGVSIALSVTRLASAQDGFYEVETKYIFGFTEGSGVGLEGEKEFSVESIARIGKAEALLGERDKARIRIHAEPVCSI